jgi:hypothetical protein
MQRTIELIQSGSQFELNGTCLNKSDLCLLLGVHGFDIDIESSNLDFYFKAIECLKVLDESELARSLEDYSKWDAETREFLTNYVKNKKSQVEILGGLGKN